jgi:hypothetical protein
MKLIKYFFVSLIFSLSLFMISPVLAADQTPLGGLDATAGKIDAYKSQVSDTSARTTILNRVGGIVGLILSFVGVIFLVLTVYAGLMWMTAQGNSAKVEKAKDLLINAVIGLIIVSAAYSLTLFVGNQLAK